MYSLEISRKFWNNVKFQGAAADDCWYYNKPSTAQGYGQLLWKEIGVSKLSHRMAYELTYGEIPDGYVIDHECHNRDPYCVSGKQCKHRACCNPIHLVAKTLGENVRAAHIGRRVIKTHCPHGHEFTQENTLIISDGRRQCRKCAAWRANRWYAQKIGKPIPART
jgi:hypothetical protein